MGLLNLFKKLKDTEPTSETPIATISFTEAAEPSKYDPWCGENSNSDFSNVNFLNRYQSGTIGETNDDYPRYISYEYNIHSPLLKHKEMIEKGYLEKGEFSDALKELKVSELKAILATHNLPVSGKKTDLIQRILTSDINKDTVDIPLIYVLSDKGKEYVEKYVYYIKFANYLNNSEVTLEAFDKIKAQQPYLSVTDIVWQIYNARYIEHQTNGDYGLLRNLEMSRYELLKSENRLADATYRLIATLYYELSGMGNGNCINDFEDICTYPLACQALKELKSYITDDMIDRCYSRLDVPFRYFEKQTFKKIIEEATREESVDLNKYKHLANKKP